MRRHTPGKALPGRPRTKGGEHRRALPGTHLCPLAGFPFPPRGHTCAPPKRQKPPHGHRRATPPGPTAKLQKKQVRAAVRLHKKARKDKARMQETHWQSSLRKGTSRAGKNIFLFFPHKAFAISKRLTTFATANAKSLFAEVAGKPLGGGPFVYRLGRKIFILERGVRFPHGLQ